MISSCRNMWRQRSFWARGWPAILQTHTDTQIKQLILNTLKRILKETQAHSLCFLMHGLRGGRLRPPTCWWTAPGPLASLRWRTLRKGPRPSGKAAVWTGLWSAEMVLQSESVSSHRGRRERQERQEYSNFKSVEISCQYTLHELRRSNKRRLINESFSWPICHMSIGGCVLLNYFYNPATPCCIDSVSILLLLSLFFKFCGQHFIHILYF